MTRPTHLRCIRCSKAFALDAYARGCDACLREGIAANLTIGYEGPHTGERVQLPARPSSMWRYASLLHASADEAVSLGEGLTPLVDLHGLGLGRLWLKDESRNPTGSFKDRLASAAVTMAKKFGATVIASSSSGNAGAATAAYASRAGLPCVVLTYSEAAGPMLTQMRAYGAMVLTVRHSADRWRVLSEAVDRYGWYPTSVYFGPAAGSNPMGVEGYKTIAYEIAESMDWNVPTWCAVPACYGDSLYGIWKGFQDLLDLGWTDRMPRLLAAEVSGSLTQAMHDAVDLPPVRPLPRPSVATSIGAQQATYQAIAALRATNGLSVQVGDAEIVGWHARLARSGGLYAEPAAVAPLPAIEKLRSAGVIAPHDTVVSLLTATGLKDTATTERSLAPVPHIEPNTDAALRALEESYGHAFG